MPGTPPPEPLKKGRKIIHQEFTQAVETAHEEIGMSNQDLANAIGIEDPLLIQHEFTSQENTNHGFLENQGKQRIIECVAHTRELCTEAGFSDHIGKLRELYSENDVLHWETLSRHLAHGRGPKIFDEWSSGKDLPSTPQQRYRIIKKLQSTIDAQTPKFVEPIEQNLSV